MEYFGLNPKIVLALSLLSVPLQEQTFLYFCNQFTSLNSLLKLQLIHLFF